MKFHDLRYEVEVSVTVLGNSDESFEHAEAFRNKDLLIARKEAFKFWKDQLTSERIQFRGNKYINRGDIGEGAAFSCHLFLKYHTVVTNSSQFQKIGDAYKEELCLTDQDQTDSLEIEKMIYKELGIEKLDA